MSKMVDYSIIIPAYNEEKIIANTIDEVFKFFKNINRSFEIIIANDGSKDNTAKVVNSKIKNYKQLRLVNNHVNMGRGEALNNAINNSNGKIVVYIDADLAIDLELFPKLVNAIEKNNVDIAVGSKHMKNSVVEYPKLRRLFSKAYSMLTRILLGSTIRDYQCGFKAFKKESIIKIIPYIKAKKWSWDTEVIVKAQWLGYKVQELPAKVVNIYGRESKVHLIKDIKNMGSELLRLFFERITFKPKN
ncbi:glycosyltransferase family 2 protein [Candidatus Woesearchaeota archaeon]|nr:glycosyltransferase family 2 protein [Candidatus Woesearchaeota archaeon]